MTTFHILDTETASLKGPPVEVAYLEVDANLSIIREFRTLVDPGCPIDPGAQAVHGISDDMVRGQPRMEDIAEQLPNASIENLVCHNVSFDHRMIKPWIKVENQICTLQLARAELATITSSNKLEVLQQELCLPRQTSHSALGDVHTVRDLLLWFRDHKGITLTQLLARAQTPQIIHKMPFGKSKGTPLTKLAASYRTWLLSQDIDKNLRYSLERLEGL